MKSGNDLFFKQLLYRSYRCQQMIVLMLVCFSTAVSLTAQSKILSKNKQPSYTIADARALVDTDPQQAVTILNSIINSKRRDSEQLSQAYTLLGDINVNNKLYPQSIDRYQKALSHLNKKSTQAFKAELNYKIGKSYLEVRASDAIKFFDNCMTMDDDGIWFYPCMEGSADAYAAVDSVRIALQGYDQLTTTSFGTDKDNLSRIQAKMATLYAIQDNIGQAIDVYNQSQSNYQPGKIENDKAAIEATNTIVSKNKNVGDEIALRNSNVTAYAKRRELVAEERIQLAEAYVKSGNADKALEELRMLKPVISVLPESTKADYFKKNSEIYTLQGDYKAALENFEKYESSRDAVLDARETELNNRLAISDLQSFVDITEKEYENEQDRSNYLISLSKRKNWIIYLLMALLLGTLVATYLIYRNVRAKQKANQLLELRSLRSEMNPHFIFNALGSVNEFIATQEPRKANRFLADFSTLMRSAMEMNKKDLIPLQEELKFSELYLKLEHARWAEKFNYEIDINYEIIDGDYKIPPLLVQPYIENAIWHGLRYKNEVGLLTFRLTVTADGTAVILIEDDGIGREKSKANKTKNQSQYISTGMRNTNKRANLINALYEKKLQIEIADCHPQKSDPGTRVEIKLS